MVAFGAMNSSPQARSFTAMVLWGVLMETEMYLAVKTDSLAVRSAVEKVCPFLFVLHKGRLLQSKTVLF